MLAELRQVRGEAAASAAAPAATSFDENEATVMSDPRRAAAQAAQRQAPAGRRRRAQRRAVDRRRRLGSRLVGGAGVRVLQRVVTAAALGGLLTGGVLFVRSKATRPTVGQRFHTYALFRDGSRLPLGSQVVIAGVRVGEIESLTIEGRLARIGMRLRDDVVLYDDAFAMKKSSSLLGDNYVELAPGGESDQPGPRRRLVSGEPIARVVEGASTDRMLRAVDTALPRVDRGLARARTVVGDARTWTTGVVRHRGRGHRGLARSRHRGQLAGHRRRGRRRVRGRRRSGSPA
jgi:hypothetical protein